MMEEEIHFLVDEITEKLNHELQSVLQQLKDPKAKERVVFINRFAREVVKAAAQKRERPQQISRTAARTPERTKEFYIQSMQQELPHRPVYRQPYYTQITQPVQRPQPVPKPIVQQPQQKKEEVVMPPVKKIEEEKNLSAETMNFDLASERPAIEPKRQQLPPQNEPVFSEESAEHLSLIKESATKQTVASAAITATTYHIFEPPLDPQEQQLLEEVKRGVLQDIESAKDKILLYQLIQKIARQRRIPIPEGDEMPLMKLRYYIVRDLLNLGPVEPLLHDDQTQKIMCDGAGKPIVLIRQGKVLETNIRFNAQEEINALLQQVAKKTYQQLSLEEPMLDATYKEFRIQGNIGTEMVPAKFIIVRG